MIYFGTQDGVNYGAHLKKYTTLKSCIEIPEREWLAIVNQANAEGKIIKADADGNPILEDAPQPTEKENLQNKLEQLEFYLKSTDWYAIRYADTGISIPEEIKQKRQTARLEISELREKINLI